ncbi:MAG: S1C family serine protease [Myxococcota bacterium]
MLCARSLTTTVGLLAMWIPISTSLAADGLDAEELRNIEIFQRASRSVVHITRVSLRRDLFSFDVFQVPSGTGSGIVWDRDGHIVTNYHVIEGGSFFEVSLPERDSWKATLVGVAPAKDLAVLRLKEGGLGLEPLALGRSANLQVGQRVLAVGNPFGLDQSLSVGVVSALGRELQAPNGRTIHDVIQTDAAINPGNSGGPLLDSSGRLIGVNSAIYSPSGASAGIGFAVPVDTVKHLVPQLIRYGHPRQPGIGITVLSDRIAKRYGFEGVVIREVQPGSPAERVGLVGLRVTRGETRLGDQILAVDGVPVQTVDELLHAFEEKGVGARVRLELLRDDRRRKVDVELIAVR